MASSMQCDGTREIRPASGLPQGGTGSVDMRRLGAGDAKRDDDIAGIGIGHGTDSMGSWNRAWRRAMQETVAVEMAGGWGSNGACPFASAVYGMACSLRETVNGLSSTALFTDVYGPVYGRRRWCWEVASWSSAPLWTRPVFTLGR